MILSGPEIQKQYYDDRIHISEFDLGNIGPNSYDVRLGNSLLVYSGYSGVAPHVGKPLDVRKENPAQPIPFHESGLILTPGVLYLGHTVEEVGSDHYVPMLEGRSSLGRLGLKVHVTAGFGDVGFKSQWTLELEVTHPLRIYPGMRIAQVYFLRLEGEKKLYQGKYLHSEGPIASQSWRDFDGS